MNLYSNVNNGFLIAITNGCRSNCYSKCLSYFSHAASFVCFRPNIRIRIRILCHHRNRWFYSSSWALFTRTIMRNVLLCSQLSVGFFVINLPCLTLPKCLHRVHRDACKYHHRIYGRFCMRTQMIRSRPNDEMLCWEKPEKSVPRINETNLIEGFGPTVPIHVRVRW